MYAHASRAADVRRVSEAMSSYGEYARRESFLRPVSASLPDYLPSVAEVEHCARCVLAALYLPGGPRGAEPPRKGAAEAMRWLRGEGASLRSASRVLARRGMASESLILDSPGLLAWAERQVRAARVLTLACPEYPSSWGRKLGSAAPPALWKKGRLPEGPCLAVVGSRWIESRVRRFAEETGQEAVRLGYSVASGAAAGCDRAAARGAVAESKAASLKGEGEAVADLLGCQAPGVGRRECWRPLAATEDEGFERRASREPSSASASGPAPGARRPAPPLVEILPCGLAMRRERFAGCVLSPFALKEGFSGPGAMQRNSLVYATADAAVIVHARLGEGGTWRGAVEANRRRLCRLIVRDAGEPWSKALIGLGAVPLREPSGLAEALAQAGVQGELGI